MVYPRVCGGTSVLRCRALPSSGLSPRVRGNPTMPTDGISEGGSIPACAGEPARQLIGQVRVAVYPRVCGGTARVGLPGDAGVGLSPRVRGNRLSVLASSPAKGSIPACAGEPAERGGQMGTPRVYPRVCGGTYSSTAFPRWRPGLSPRVRGNHPAIAPRQQEEGSIPACAGEPPSGRRWQGWCRVYPRVCGGTPGVEHLLE